MRKYVHYDIIYIKIWEKRTKYPIIEEWISILVSEECVMIRNVLVKGKKQTIEYVHNY